MIVIVAFMIFNLGKQFFYKNILFPSTLIVEQEEKLKVNNNNLPEVVTNIVKDNLEANKIIENKIVIQTVEVIKEIIVMVTPTPRPYKEYKGIYSWYYPPLGGINCDTNPDGTEECDYMANGERWEKWENIGCACPEEIPFNTEIYIKELNLKLTCVDRGGAIVKDENDNYWIDHLTNNPLLYWSTPITLIIYE